MGAAEVRKPAVERVHPPNSLMRLVNPITRRLIAAGRMGEQVLLLHYRGHKSGRNFDVPAGYIDIDGVPSVLTNSGWRHNFRGGRDIEVTIRGHRRPARAILVDDPDVVAATYQRLIDEIGVKGAQRRLGVRINMDRPPTQDELREMVERSGLSICRIEDR
jgi:hypothetical protein